MPGLRIHLLGKFYVRQGEVQLSELESRKAEELLCYLLVNRERAHPRDALADLLWGKEAAHQSKNYLRKALWQLQSALDNLAGPDEQRLLLLETEWIRINPHCPVWLDIDVIEVAFGGVKGIAGRSLNQEQARELEAAVAIYKGDLMEGCYWDWCLFERERMQYLYLTLLEKLMDYSEAIQDYESGLAHGERVLRYDRAHERTHTHLMRLHYLAGDRTAALRQYEKCQAALHEELDIEPGELTRELYQQIREDALEPWAVRAAPKESMPNSEALQKIHDRLRHFYQAIGQLQAQLQNDMQVLEQVIRK